MRIQYVITKEELNTAKRRLEQMRQIALMARDAGDADTNREFYLKAKGFEEALTMLGFFPTGDNTKRP